MFGDGWISCGVYFQLTHGFVFSRFHFPYDISRLVANSGFFTVYVDIHSSSWDRNCIISAYMRKSGNEMENQGHEYNCLINNI